MATTYLNRTLAANNQKKLTISLWVKFAKIQETMLVSNYYSGSYWGSLYLGSDHTLRFDDYRNSYILKVRSTEVFRDVGAWYHIVANFDCSISSPTAKLYVNGSEVSYSVQTIYSQNATTSWNTDYDFQIGKGTDLGGNNLEGCISDLYFIQGYTYDASTFGETDSTSGIWVPKTQPTINYGGTGGNSCHLKFENAGNLDLDSGSNNVSFTTTGALTQTTDTPSNNFATLNPLLSGIGTGSNAVTYMANNTRCDVGNNVWRTMCSTMAVSSGKWYFEGFGTSQASAYQHYGITSVAKFDQDQTMPDKEINEEQQTDAYSYGYYGNNGQIYYSTPSSRSNGAYGATYGASDYVGIFVDLDNNKLYVAKNGTLANSGTGYDISADGKPYFLAMSIYGANAQINFGSGTFGYASASYSVLTGTTYADANGHGIFKYSPNQGGASNFDSAAKNFYMLNTKNLKEFG